MSNTVRTEVKAARAEVRSYGEIYAATCDLYEPENETELRAVLAKIAAEGRKVTFRAGGYALDAQSVNDAVVVSLARMDGIEVDEDPVAPTVTCGPGARWGDILRTLEPKGLLAKIMVTASGATAGGTAAADGVSRFTTTFGKESEQIVSLDLMTVDGTVHTLRPDSDDESVRELFYGVIGGLGYLGVIVRVTYSVFRPNAPGFPRLPLRVLTRVKKCQDLNAFVKTEGVRPSRPSSQGHVARALFEAAKKNRDDDTSADPVAFYGVVCSGHRLRGLVFESRYVRTNASEPMLQHQPDHPLRFMAEWVARFPLTSGLFWQGTYEMFDERTDYVDDLFGYTFFMDGNVRTRSIEKKLRMRTFTLQQTYVIPFSQEKLHDFLEGMQELVEDRTLVPTLFDVLYVPADKSLLSASRGRDGFAVTMAFETGKTEEVPAMKAALSALARVCLDIGGRVHLGKTVFAEVDDLRAMYGDALPAFRKLKDRYDPKRLLDNAFLHRIFPELSTLA